MQTTIRNDPRQLRELVCQAFKRDELKELLLGENNYGYKMDLRNDYTGLEEKTDSYAIYSILVEFYLTLNKNELITQKLTDTLTNLPETHWGIYVFANIITYEARRKNKQGPTLNLNLDQLAHHLKNIIQNNRAAIMQEKLYGGQAFDQGMFEYLNRRSARSVSNDGPAFIAENPSAEDHFEATTTFTLTLPDKLADLTDELHNTFMNRATVVLKNSLILQDNSPIASKDSTWTYTMERQKQPTSETQFVCMVNNIYSEKAKLMNLIKKMGIKAQLNSIIWSENPDQHATILPSALQKLNEMNIPFNIDIQLKTI